MLKCFHIEPKKYFLPRLRKNAEVTTKIISHFHIFLESLSPPKTRKRPFFFQRLLLVRSLKMTHHYFCCCCCWHGFVRNWILTPSPKLVGQIDFDFETEREVKVQEEPNPDLMLPRTCSHTYHLSRSLSLSLSLSHTHTHTLTHPPMHKHKHAHMPSLTSSLASHTGLYAKMRTRLERLTQVERKKF